MPLRRTLLRPFYAVCFGVLAVCPSALAQTPSSKFEVGGQFTGISLYQPNGTTSFSSGFGGRFDWNFSRRIALDAQVDFFPQSTGLSAQAGGRTTQILAGFRGKFIQRRRFAVYGLLRPGITFNSNTLTSFNVTETSTTPPTFVVTANNGGAAHFTLDLGGGVEFYPSPHWIFRAEIDASPYFVGSAPVHFVTPPPTSGLVVSPVSGVVTDTWRVSTGMSYRPGPIEPSEPLDSAPKQGEVGAAFTSLSLQWIDGTDRASTEPGVGIFASYPLWQFIYLDAALNFFPRQEPTSGPNDGGRILQGLFGTKTGFQGERWGFFVKVRPGFINYSRTLSGVSLNPAPPVVTYSRATDFTLDVGGVVEYRLGRRFLLRFDAGNTILYNSPRNYSFNGTVYPSSAPGRRNTLQLALGFAFRF